MAKTPASSSSTPGIIGRTPLGWKLIGTGITLMVLTRIVRWLPLGFVGSWINGLLWPVLLVCLGIGGFLTYRRSSRS